MLKGDLTTTPLAPLLVDLANDAATGCLHIIDPADEEALVFFKTGLVYAVSVPGSRPQLGAKLVSSGALAPEALSEALEAQRTELQGWRLGELLVHLGYVDQPVVEAFIKEQVSEAVWDLLRWTTGRWKFRKNIKAREDVGPPMVVVDLLEHLRERGYEWETISAVVHGPGAVPKLSTRGDTSAETMLDNDAWSMLCKIDGVRSVSDLASDCGYTLFEAGHVIVSLVQAGLVDIDEVIDTASTELYGATTLSSALAGDLDDSDDAGSAVVTEIGVAEHDVDSDAMSRLARMVNEFGGNIDEEGAEAPLAASAQATEPATEPALVVPLLQHSSESFAASMARVSNALSDVLGDTPQDTDANDSHAYSMARHSGQSTTSDPEWQRRKRLRTAAAEELATAHALIEAEHTTSDLSAPLLADGEIPKVVSHETELRRVAAREAAKAAKAAEDSDTTPPAEALTDDEDATDAAAEAERAAAEQAEADRIETERIAAAEAEAERVAAERAAAEQAEAERAETERAETERAEAERAEAERVAAEAAERVAAEQAEAEQAEAERLEAERLEAERLEAERVENERLEAERAEAEQAEAEQAEAERLAAEQAAAAEQAESESESEETVADDDSSEEALTKSERNARRKAEKQAAEEAEQAELAAAAASAMLIELATSSETTPTDEGASVDAAVDDANESFDDEPIIRDEAASAAATALLLELANTADPEPTTAQASDNSEAVEDTAADIEPDPEPDPEPASRPWDDAGMADTAALLRELSSLGDDAAPQQQSTQAAGPQRTPRAPAAADKKAKKKIGLFGL
jgi:hypothetical protein